MLERATAKSPGGGGRDHPLKLGPEGGCLPAPALLRLERPSRRGRRAIAGAIGLLALIGGGSVGPADSLDARLAGAWAPSAADCAKLFQRRGGALTFRQPIDKFAQAEIIGPQTILAPSSSCRVLSVSRESGASKVNTECNDSISFRQESVWIKVQPSGEIVYSPTGDPALGTTFIKCAM
jgi:hypothetical protein